MAQSLVQQARFMQAAGVNTYPLVHAALIGILTALDVAPLTPSRFAQTPLVQWPVVLYAARDTWAVEHMDMLAEPDTPPVAPGVSPLMALEVRLSQNPAQNLPRFINAVSELVRDGQRYNTDGRGGQALALGVAPEVAASFYRDYAVPILDDIANGTLIRT